MVEREPGFYWVRDKWDEEWTIGEYVIRHSVGEWKLYGYVGTIDENSLAEIGERVERIDPIEKAKQ